jgi:carboxymethylenebutenolidase
MPKSGTIELAHDGKQTLDAFVATPESGSGPGILICTEMWGVSPAQCERAKLYAERGFCAIVPNIFWKSTPSGLVSDEGPAREVAWERMRAFAFDDCIEELGRSIDWLLSQPTCNGKVATIGFCMGGRLAIMAALRHRIEAGVSLYGFGLTDFESQLRETRSRLQLHYGADDIHIKEADAKALGDALAGNPNVDVWIYPDAGHGFFNETRKAYNRAAVTLATQRMDALFDSLR